VATPAYYDVILDSVGRSPFSECLRAITPSGAYLLANPSPWATLRGAWASATGHRKVVTRGSRPRAEELDLLRTLIESGKVRCVVDRVYPLEEVSEAHRYIDSGRALGRAVITPSNDRGGVFACGDPHRVNGV
jgi:NADPH:quinone reductase-like Zn-dependent oxidoreductase